MKTDITTAIIAAIVGVIVAYFVTGFVVPAIEDVSFKVLAADPQYSLTEPNPEIFNYRAINPTVEVYVGQCLEYNENGECIDNGVTTVTDGDNSSANPSGESQNGASN